MELGTPGHESLFPLREGGSQHRGPVATDLVATARGHSEVSASFGRRPARGCRERGVWGLCKGTAAWLWGCWGSLAVTFFLRSWPLPGLRAGLTCL